MEYAAISPLSSAVSCTELIAIDRFPITTAARTAKTSLAIGLAYGLAQDAIGAARGRPLGWVEFIRRGGRRKEATAAADSQSIRTNAGTSQIA